MSSFKGAEKIGRKYIPPAFARVGKTAVSHLRYRAQLKKARQGYLDSGSNYSNHVVFIAGLPKSGTTWLENLVTANGELTSIMPPEAVAFEQNTGGSHDYELSVPVFARLNQALALMKLHCHGSDNNVSLLRRFNVPVVALFRDLRDVAVSYIFYVKKTPYHPDFRNYRDLDMNEALARFGTHLLPAYRDWILSWQGHMDDSDVLVLKYEELHADTLGVLRQVFKHFDFSATDLELEEIIEAKSFKNMAKGVTSSKVDTSTFFRKGVTGDWVNHFNDENKVLFKNVLGDLLIQLGYENDQNW